MVLQKCDKGCSSHSKIEGAGGSMKTTKSVYDIDYQLILHNHTPPPFGHLLYLRGGVLIRFRSIAAARVLIRFRSFAAASTAYRSKKLLGGI